jgi:hypothetical protein
MFGEAAFCAAAFAAPAVVTYPTGWVLVNSDQSTIWQNVSNPSTATWAQVSTVQTPSWTPVTTL